MTRFRPLDGAGPTTSTPWRASHVTNAPLPPAHSAPTPQVTNRHCPRPATPARGTRQSFEMRRDSLVLVPQRKRKTRIGRLRGSAVWTLVDHEGAAAALQRWLEGCGRMRDLFNVCGARASIKHGPNG